ncbi:ABC transporter ATP-binding protein [Desulfosporosinus fructosivorans]
MLTATSNDIVLQDATVHFAVSSGSVQAVDHVFATFYSGQITGLIGESGCGKSILGLAILGLLPSSAQVGGDIFYGGINIVKASPQQLRSLRGRKIGLIPQNPGDSLNPVRRIGVQLDEALMIVEKNLKHRRLKADSLLRSFGFSDPERILRSYPFELSGGMQQRVLCAIGISCSPGWVLADEPTKGLDRDLREQVYETLFSMRLQGVDGMIVITHDLVLAEKLCDCVAVMYSGEILEMGQDVLKTPLHPYTQAFLDSLPRNGMKPMPGRPPQPGESFAGCKFEPRCRHSTRRCRVEKPASFQRGSRIVRCFLYA